MVAQINIFSLHHDNETRAATIHGGIHTFPNPYENALLFSFSFYLINNEIYKSAIICTRIATFMLML